MQKCQKKCILASKMMIETTKELEKVCRRFAAYPFMTIDTEFVREKTYFPAPCLIQIASPKEAFCLDPLSQEVDFQPFYELLQNKNVVKVFHAGRQDIEILYRMSGSVPTPVFDTQIGAMVCGFGENVSYQQLVKQCVQVEIDKSQRCTNWERRPLSPAQIKYALCDVTYLRDVYAYIQAELVRTGRESWIAEELESLTDERTYNPDPESIVQKIKPQNMRGKVWQIYQALYIFREQMAREKDRPRRHLMKDELLQELAVVRPTDPEQLKEMRSVSKGFEKSDVAKQLIEIIRQTTAEEPKADRQFGHEKALTATQRNKLELLKVGLHLVAINEGVASSLIASTDTLEAFVRGKPVAFQQGWRQTVFGHLAEKMMTGRVGIVFRPEIGKACLVEIPVDSR